MGRSKFNNMFKSQENIRVLLGHHDMGLCPVDLDCSMGHCETKISSLANANSNFDAFYTFFL